MSKALKANVVSQSSGALTGHAEAAQRISQAASRVTTKEQAQKMLRSAGILNKHNKLVKTLA